MTRSVLFACFCLLLACGTALGQTDRGTITGTIIDPAGAMIPGATIEAKNTNTGSVFQVSSTSTGNYTLAQLPAGKYQLSASMPGFKQFLRTGITVLVAQTLRIDIQLEVGEITDTVTVSADAPLLRTESGDLSHNIASETLAEVPMIGWANTIRDPYTVTQLIPGAYYRDRNSVRIGGTPANTQSLRVEGQDATHSMLQSSTAQSAPSVEAVEEFAVQTSNYSAEFGQAGGAVFNLTMKSGTNAYHGSFYDYIKNEALNAATPFQNVKSRQRRHNYGFTVSGPVYIPKVYDGHDKFFFFFNWEQFREKVNISTQKFTVPTADYRNGDFSQAMTGRVLAQDPLGRNIIEGTIYDPATERLVNGLRVRDPFPDNTIPIDRFDPVGAKIQALIPQATNSDLVNNYLSPWLNRNVRTIPGVKVDYNLSSQAKLSFYWSSTSQDSWQNLGPAGGDGIDSPITTHRPTDIKSHTIRLNFDYTMSPTQILHLGAGVQHTNFNDIVEFKDFDQLKELGLPGAQITVFPYITGLTASLGGMRNMGPNAQAIAIMLKPTANASLTWVKSNHTYKFGAEMRIEGFPNDMMSNAMGSYTFNAQQTGLPSTLGQNLQGGTVGFPYASFLLGLVHSGDIAVVTNPRLGKNAWALFAQDSWKVTRKLTLDYGLRWDYQTYFKEQYGRFPNFSPTEPNPGAGNLPGAVIFERDGVEFARNYPYAFGPRLGLAYQIMPKTVLRAGFGITYGQTASENQASRDAGSSNPFSSPSYGDPAILLKDGPPAPKPWPNLDPGQYPLSGTHTTPPAAVDHNAGRPPRQIQWSLSIQHEIAQNLLVEAAYVGNRGAWWEANGLIDVNALTAERIASFGLNIDSAADRTLLTSRLDSSIAEERGFNNPPYPSFPMSSTVAQSLRPFPQFTTISYRWAPLGRTWYDSMQLKVTKRFSHGLDFTSNFTWQKELTMGQDNVGMVIPVTQAINDVFDRKSNKYLSGLSRPFSFVTAVNYTTPKLAQWNKVLSMLLSDWTLSAMLQYTSGMPIRVPIAQSRLSTLLFRDTFANRVPGEPLWTVDINDPSTYDPFSDFVLNPKAWEDPLPGHFGVSPAYYNDYRQMRRPSEAMSLGRIFNLSEKAQLSIRADFNNVFNRLVIGNPSSTNAKATQTVRPGTGETQSGFGDINTNFGTNPRSGMIVARIQF